MSNILPQNPPSLKRRRPQVYVEIPHSALLHSSSSPSPAQPKDNTPLRPSRSHSHNIMTTPNPAGAHSKKRKLADGEQDDDQTNQHDDAARPKAKKSKHSQVAPQQDTKKSRGLSQEYPTGFVHCHQCTKKRDATLVVQCTIKASGKGSRRCTAKYCQACLKNRYDTTLDDVKAAASLPLTKKQKEEHISGLGYHWKCPRCCDTCDCPQCRSKQGLPPVGKKVLQIPKESAEDKALPGKAKPANSTKNSKAAKASGSSASGSKKTAKAPARLKPKAAPQPVPRPVWTRVPTSLSNGDVETRMHIREFILRFATALAIPHNQLDELDELSGEELGDATNSEDEDEESVELVGWVSEPCVKSIVLGLLHVIAGGAEGRNAHRETKALEEAIQNVKSSGANLNKLWGALVSLREEEDFSLEFSDPLPPPASNTCRSTRSGGVDSILVATSAQLVPVIADLIEATMTIPAMHKAIDAGFTEEKNLTTNMQAAIKKELNWWKALQVTKDKARREQHNQNIRDIANAHYVAAIRSVSRFTSVGRDRDGRIYYMMTPGLAESHAAVQFLDGKDVKVKFGRKRGGLTENDRKDMVRWPWFVAVWGRKPEGALEAKPEKDEDCDDDDKPEDEDESGESWWGFWQPEEIEKLAGWISRTSGLESDEETDDTPVAPVANGNGKVNSARGRRLTSGSNSSLSSLSSTHSIRDPSPLSDLSSDEDEEEHVSTDKQGRRIPNKRELGDLVKGLNDYADRLKWRIQRASREDTTTENSVRNTRKAAAIPTSRFYS